MLQRGLGCPVVFAVITYRELIPAQCARLMRFLAHDEEEEKPDKYQNRACCQSQCAPGKKYERKTSNHYYARDDVNNYRVFINAHTMLPIF
jgi:predicted solute-binding protein